LTPVELFKPHYSHIIANFCSQQANLLSSAPSKSSDRLALVELGCGRGTNASLIFFYLKTTNSAIYEQVESYTLIDSSPSLHKLQTQVLATGEHANKVRFELMDLVDVARGKRPLFARSKVPTIVLQLEILDNLPHDKIRGKTRKKWSKQKCNGLDVPNPTRGRFLLP
jgi:SAM-dependent MidA family methyltransferase